MIFQPVTHDSRGFPADADHLVQDMPRQGFGILLYLPILLLESFCGKHPASVAQFLQRSVDVAEFLPKREGTACGSPVSVLQDIL